MAAARSAALTKARGYNQRSGLISQVSFEGCHRTSSQKIHCTFHGSGRTNMVSNSCEIRVVVSGEGSHAQAKLRATCRSERLLLLTFARAIPVIQKAGEELASRGVAIAFADRINDLEIEAIVEWDPAKKVKEKCEARFVAQLNSTDEVLLDHGPAQCSSLPGPVQPEGPVTYP